MIDPRDIDEIVKRYTERIEKLGANVRALGSGTDEHQAIRYRVLSEIGDLGGQRVLDVGCGFGGFYNYCRHNDQPMTYTGVDIVPAMVEEARKLHPGVVFKHLDILSGFSEFEDEEFDYVVSSQAFNNKYKWSDNMEVIKKVIEKCFSMAKKGVAIDLVSSYVDFRDDHLFYFDPGEVFSFCKSLTKRVSLRHDYPLFEFCIYLYPDFKGWRNDK